MKLRLLVLLWALLLLAACGPRQNENTSPAAPSSVASGEAAPSQPAPPAESSPQVSLPEESSLQPSPPEESEPEESEPEESEPEPESSLPEESEAEPDDDDESPDFAVAGEDYLYDPATGRLSFPGLGFGCTVPPEAMDHLELEMYSRETESEAGDGSPVTIDYINFYYMEQGAPYRVFLFYRWPAEDWDIPRPYGPLPHEIARDSGGQYVILHGPAALAARGDSRGLWGFVEEYEDAVAQSVAFDE